MKRELRGLWEDVLELVYPSGIYCISCGRPMDQRFPYSLCGNCVQLLRWAGRDICGRCGRPVTGGGKGALCGDCAEEERRFKKGFTCVGYGEREKAIIHDFKYGGKAYYGEKLAKLMAERIELEESFKELGTSIEELRASSGFDLIIPVPMYKEKEKDRGYNQAAVLGKHLARRLGISFLDHGLIRCRNTPPMSSLSAGERRQNVKGAFAVNERVRRQLTGKVVLLVDDVFTTGSTVEACAEVLREAGAQTVFVITFASTEGIY